MHTLSCAPIQTSGKQELGSILPRPWGEGVFLVCITNLNNQMRGDFLIYLPAQNLKGLFMETRTKTQFISTTGHL